MVVQGSSPLEFLSPVEAIQGKYLTVEWIELFVVGYVLLTVVIGVLRECQHPLIQVLFVIEGCQM